MYVRALDTPHESVVDLKPASPPVTPEHCDTYLRTAQRGRQIAHDQPVARILSRSAFVSVAAGLVVFVGALRMDATGNAASALRAVFAQLIWAATFAGGHTLQRRNS